MSQDTNLCGVLEESDRSALEGIVQKLLSLKGVRHAIVAVESRDGTFRWVGTAGSAQPDGTPMKEDTPFWIASVTKLYITAAVLKLHEAGRLSIDAAAAAYLPAHRLQGLHTVKGVDYWDKLTIRHLLGHSSGLPDYLELKIGHEPPLFEKVIVEEDKSWSVEDSLDRVRTANAPLFAPQPLDKKSSGYVIWIPNSRFFLR